MSREEARQILDAFIDCLYTNLTEERYQELKEAVEVLHSEPTWKRCLICGAKMEVEE